MEWQRLRQTQIKVCNQCHSKSYAERTFSDNEKLLEEADKLVLEAMKIIEKLYDDGILDKPVDFPAHPDHLEFYEVDSLIEKKLYIMFLEHRVRTFMGAFHNNPQFTHRYGWIQLKRDLTEIKDEAKKMREHYEDKKFIKPSKIPNPEK